VCVYVCAFACACACACAFVSYQWHKGGMHNSLEVVVEIAVKLLLGDTKKDELEDMITTLFKVDL